ncbi:hypothetical protein BDR04DRAFT_1232898 [Suillus decipiens]|nr:hypothetical protein BDR04DRAFT_1232898 [Suillus decipiens]
MNKARWESVDELCCTICNRTTIPFGGITFIGLGDFRQAGPIVSGAGETATLAASVNSSTLWNSIRILTLNTAIRSIGDLRFTSFVDGIGGDCTGNRQNLALIAATTSFNDMINFLFPPYVLEDTQTCLQRAFFSPLNIYVDEFNDKILEFARRISSDRLKEAEHTPLNGPEHTPDYLAMLTHP